MPMVGWKLPKGVYDSQTICNCWPEWYWENYKYLRYCSKGIPIINSDEIAKQIRLAGIATNINTYEYSNMEASKLLQDNIEAGNPYGFETNLCDVDTWKFLLGIQKSGYEVNIIYLSTDNLGLLNERIAERVLRGEHYVSPNIVEERYRTSLKLLQHYLGAPNKILLLDNSTFCTPICEIENSKTKLLVDNPPNWVNNLLIQPNETLGKKLVINEEFSSKEDVKEYYRNYLKNK